ncbi:hypothetical protein EDD18DRAFT_1160272 [Armillaria luteobubalina]|uniref:F-box domain-containing protein n=1 Tax=Armillaria luteobubalina TaxID=153913 RepID=A0AA39Q812_9AGAR|nr:hypothetical protein EDD18DRAFT_1160272 [Armillaria luteobubalina]
MSSQGASAESSKGIGSQADFNIGRTPSIFLHPDFMRLSKCNDPPSPAEETALNRIISQTESLLQILRQKIDSETSENVGGQLSCLSTVGTLGTLVEKYHETEDSIRTAKRLFSLVRHLPVEILHQIFVLAVEFPPRKIWDEGNHCWKIQHEKPSLWDLELVSKGWRSALLSCSLAWSYICLKDTRRFERTADDSAFRGLLRQVERSKPRPLSVSIHQSSRRGFPDLLIAALIHFADRIVTLQLALGVVSLQNLNPLQFFLVSLQNLSIISVTPELDTLIPDIFEAFSSAPLRSLELWQVSVPDALVISWARIRRYKHHYRHGPWDRSFHDALLQVNRFSDIEECKISCTEHFLHQIQVPGLLDMITLPKLHTLRMLGSRKGFEKLPLLLDHITTPSLARITIQAFESERSDSPAPCAVPSLFRLLQRSCCSLTCLRLTDVRVSEADMETLFHLEFVHQALQELHLSNVSSDCLTDVFLSSLQYIEPALFPLPSLHTLRLHGRCDFVPQRFVETIASRFTQEVNQKSARMRNVELVWVLRPGQLDHCQYICEELAPYQKDGLSLEVRSVQVSPG